ncbi:metaxin-2 [Eupeodes corollae]|uniref:metaxin-2 n=1 Tax=Eupeodes corollae TaxID=290404 RepID=UPI00249044C4|nr:metaxin-2 [Eupeodes corollae]XP_055908172.1 metaxin-2 [Eupeodes corollae]
MTTSTYIKQFKTEEKIASEPWPDDAVLYQPYEVEQILLAENASCLAVKAYLRMCNMPFTVRSSANAEFMSPGGRMTKLPFIKVGAFIVAEFEPIVNFVEQKEAAIGQWLNEDEKYDLRSYVSLVENIFTNAELYISFLDNEVYRTVTQPRNGCVFPWPLNTIQNFKKRRHVLKQLKVYQWSDMNLEEVLEKVVKCCETLTSKLEESTGPFFFGDEPTELDAIIFGHLFTILTTTLPNNKLAQSIQGFKKLVDFCQNIDAKYFNLS